MYLSRSFNGKGSSKLAVLLAHLGGEDDQPRIIAVARPYATASDQVEVMLAGWAKDGIDHLLAGCCSRIGHYALYHELQCFSLNSEDRNGIAWL